MIPKKEAGMEIFFKLIVLFPQRGFSLFASGREPACLPHHFGWLPEV
jgi:hypothetical protein